MRGTPLGLGAMLNSAPLFLLLVLVLAYGASADARTATPEQLHIAYGERPSEMVVVFATLESDGGRGYVRWSSDGDEDERSTSTLEATSVPSGAGLYTAWHATLANLTPGARYTYWAGWASDNSTGTADANVNWSNETGFTANIEDTSRPVRLAMFGGQHQERRPRGRLFVYHLPPGFEHKPPRVTTDSSTSTQNKRPRLH